MPGIDERTLLRLIHDGCDSEMVRFRLRYAEADSTIKYLEPLVGLERAHPNFLPTQKNGRWSTKNPPLANFSADCINPRCPRQGTEHRATTKECWSLRDVVVPDEGFFFLHWDWSAIEAKLAAAYSEDDDDLELFRLDADIHTVTFCKMYGHPVPPNLIDPYRDPRCAEWRRVTGLLVKDCWERTAAKTSRYSLAYGTDERAIHQAKDVDKLAREAGLDRKGIEAMAKAYLDSKPKLVAWKRRVWRQIMDTQEVRTPLGRRKRLFVTQEERQQYMRTGRATAACREGLNHLASAQVAGMMNRTIISIKTRWPESRLAYQAHDGWVGVFPESVNPWPDMKEIVEREWDCGNGRSIKSTAEFECIHSDGSHEELR